MPYHDLGSDYFDQTRPEVTTKQFLKRLEWAFKSRSNNFNSPHWLSHRYFQGSTCLVGYVSQVRVFQVK
jgi:hypothetical protein